MTARTHDLAAATALLVCAVVVPLPRMSLATILVALLANQLGGIAPDIDQPTAPLWRNLPIGGVVGRFFDKMLGGHRFLTHSLLGLFLFGWLTWWLLLAVQPIMPHVDSSLVWWAFMIGMVSHLVMDTFTKEGVPWLLPLPVKFGLPPLRAWRVTTGKKLEVVIFAALVGFDVYFVALHYSFLFHLIHGVQM